MVPLAQAALIFCTKGCLSQCERESCIHTGKATPSLRSGLSVPVAPALSPALLCASARDHLPQRGNVTKPTGCVATQPWVTVPRRSNAESVASPLIAERCGE